MDWPSHKLECRHLAKQKLLHQQQNQLQLQQQQYQLQNNNRPLSLETITPNNGAEGDGAVNIENLESSLQTFGVETNFDDNNWASFLDCDLDSGLARMLSENGSGLPEMTNGEANLLAGVNGMSLMLGPNEADILNTQAEIVSQNQHSNMRMFDNTLADVGSGMSGMSGSGSDNGPSYSIGRSDENYLLHQNVAGSERNEELCRNIINDMNTYGLSVVDDFLGMEKGLRILNEVHGMYAAGVFKDGQLVSSNQMASQDLRTIRGDKITWVTGVEPHSVNVGYLINQIDALITRANSMKNNGKLGNYKIRERTKAMVACYPGSGSHYVMHVDNPNKDGRVITAIYYLNVNWDTIRSGGVLRIFPEHGGSIAEIEPKFDRLIFFWSDKRNPHEVQPAHRTRYAITVWYFDAEERETALNRCKQYKNKANNSNSTTKSKISSNSMTNTNTNTNTNPSDICT